MSDYSGRISCGACGDYVDDILKHDCWVMAKIHNQENLLPECPICFEPITTPHWRCHDDGIVGSGVV